MQEQKVVVIGGGTGTSIVLSGLKQTKQCQLSAVVVVSDNGGSTRRLRDEFGFLPVGDLRQCLAALVDGDNQEATRDLLLYRFGKGVGLTGHNLGNLILTALEDMSASPGEAIATATKIFHCRGAVYPVTEANVQLVINYADGTVKVGEEFLDDPTLGGKTITSITLSPAATLYSQAEAAILAADQIVLGPGDLYGSLLPNAIVSGFPQALQRTSAQFIYVVNLMTHYSQTHGMTAGDHLATVTRYCGRQPDVVIINSGAIPISLREKYEAQHEFQVADDLPMAHTADYTIIRGDFVSKVIAQKTASDALERSLLRHDAGKLTQTLLELFNRQR